MIFISLNGKERSYLRGEANSLSPLTQIGKEGITPGVISQVEECLEDHELVKIKINDNNEISAREAASRLSEKTDSSIVQVIGSVLVLYRENPEIAGYNLPD